MDAVGVTTAPRAAACTQCDKLNIGAVFQRLERDCQYGIRPKRPSLSWSGGPSARVVAKMEPPG